jgi:hypothetical protein
LEDGTEGMMEEEGREESASDIEANEELAVGTGG